MDAVRGGTDGRSPRPGPLGAPDAAHEGASDAVPGLPTVGNPPARLGETFQTNPVTGSASLSIPLPFSAGRGAPAMAVAYDSSGRTGPFGYGWDLPVPQISRRTDRGLPRYRDDTDVFVASGAEDLVPDAGPAAVRTVAGVEYRIERFRPRIDDGLTRIERWTSTADRADCKWRTLSGDNTTAWFGEGPESRVFDPADPTRIFAWLLSSTHDGLGNAASYEYAAEDSTGIAPAASEAGRTEQSRSAARHLKRVRYGNAVPHLPAHDPVEPDARPEAWLFTLVLDYGDHDPEAPGPEPDRPWTVRPDPYTTCRPGFEVRAYRRCRRALMFHDLPELGAEPTLVRSVDFDYEQDPRSGDSRLTAVRTVGYVREGDGYARAETPPMTFHYAPAAIDPAVRDVRAEHLPAGLDLVDYTWVDLDGDGVAGVLASRRGAWYYLRNRSPLHGTEADGVAFTAARPVPERPSDGAPDPGGELLLDLDGSGKPDLVRLGAAVPGFAGRDEDGRWRALTPFASRPNVDALRVRLADLTGDGLADLVLTDPAGERWCEGLGADGFGGPLPFDAADGPGRPSLLESSATVAVQLADMTGDGLPDLVRIANGTIAYRPNLGYGRFGPTVVMDHAPRFDTADRFDPRRVLLGDLDGNGRNDLVYLAADGAHLYANRGGDAWSEARVLTGVPASDDRRMAAIVDLRGNGAGCLVWSTGLPHGTAAAMRYLDLASAGRPHLLTAFANGTGGETRIEYLPSTHFALADEQAGRPWPGTLPFPVSCAHRVTRIDHVRETAFTATTSYHDGYFDPHEREFRGFGRVETLDTEAYTVPPPGIDPDPDLHQPPALTRTWFHTGAAAATGERMLHTRRAQYWENPVLPEPPMPEPALPPGMSGEEYRQACRALKGLTLRTEVYGLDDGPDTANPYSVSESAYTIALRRPLGERRHAVFQVLPTEAVSYAYDRRPEDPRVVQSMVLETDDRGLPLRSASVAYRRSVVDPALPQRVREAQARTCGGYREVDYTEDVLGPDTRRLRQVCETRDYELAGLPGDRSTAAAVDAAVADAERVPYETVRADGTVPTPDGPVLRLIERAQAFFLADDLTGPLPLGTHGRLGLGHHSRSLTLTDGLVAGGFDGSVTAAELAAAGYEHFDGGWWTPSGTDLYGPDAADHFHLPVGSADPLGVTTTVTRDAHDLAVVTATDPLGNETHLEHDYRLLAPRAITDANGNRAEVAFDTLGAAVATALLGKPGEANMDTLADPTATMEYDLFAWADEGRPVSVRTRRRERHGPENTAWQETFAYFDGAGTPVMAKNRVAPGPAPAWDPATASVSEVEADPRWVGNGRTVLNNKGLPVKRYEPYFSATHEYESEAALVEIGVTDVPRYDALGRVFRVDHPDGTFTRTEFGPWRSVGHDAADTVLDSAWYAERGSPDPLGPEPADPRERAAWISARHAGTPGVAHLDVLGRTVLTVADNGDGDLRYGRTEADATGGHLRGFDTRDRIVTAAVRDLSGAPVRADSAERGRRWSLTDIVGRLVRTWDEHGRAFRVAYDAAHRPVATFASEPGGPERQSTRIVYGDAHPEAAERNLLGQTLLLLDASGAAVFDRFDHQGNPLRVLRRLTTDPETDPDWSATAGIEDPALVLAAADALLEPLADQAESTAAFDALGRLTAAVLPDGTELDPAYDEGNRLAELRARIGGSGPMRTFMSGQEYDALGRRALASYGNGLTTACTYDPLSRRVERIRTAAGAAEAVQDLRYVYEAQGRLVEADDAAQQSLFFAGAFVPARMRFHHDALGQLVHAEGREHAGIPAGQQTGPGDAVGASLPHPDDTAAVRRYRQRYEYDDLGNLTLMRHIANGGGWTRRYRYAHEADPSDPRNRLTATSLPGDDPEGPYSHQYAYDHYGNLTSAPHLASLAWNHADQLREADLGGGGTAWYGYTASGNRSRKVIQRQGGLRTERRYLGSVEVYREWMNGTLRLERRTVHLGDDAGRFAQVDTLVLDTAGTDGATVGEPVVRYQYGNHIGSATLETDEDGSVISYEEYHPYGSTAYRSSRPGANLSLKRYRFHGKERDEETGLYHYGARYYAPWLGRWASADPAGAAAGPNLYAYCGNDPSGRIDPNGTQDGPASPETRVIRVRDVPATGEMTFAQLRELAAGIPGWEWDPAVTPENYQSFFRDGIWVVLRQVAPGSAAEGGDAGAGADGGGDAPGAGDGAAESGAAGSGSGGADEGDGGDSDGDGDGGGDDEAGDSDGGGSGGGPALVPRPGPVTGPLAPTRGVAPVDLPQARPGTDFRAAERAGRARARAGGGYGIGDQAQHYLKWREGRRTNLDPRITNDPRYMGPLQSRNALAGPGYPRLAPDGNRYGNPHTYADRGLYPSHLRNVARSWWSGLATERVRAVEAGRRTMQSMTGSRGPIPPYIFGPTLATAGGNLGVGVARGLLPGVAEAETAFIGGSMYAGMYGYAAVSRGLFLAGAYTPVAAVGLVSGAVVGGGVGGAVRAAGGSREDAIVAGFVAGAATGALIGAICGTVLPGVGNLAGYAVGAIIGGIAGGIGGILANW